MSILYEERLSDAPYVERVTHGRTASDGSAIRPAECHWHMVFVNHMGGTHPVIVGPWTTAGVASWAEGAEILWVKFKLGVFMPRLPAHNFLNAETILPQGACRSFHLDGAVWQFPTYENVDTFVNQLVRNEVLVHDPLVDHVRHGRVPDMPSRTVRHRFAQATGLTQSHVYQWERAQQAAVLLQQGTSILDTLEATGYFDQSHLTKALKRFVGQTPAQLLRGEE